MAEQQQGKRQQIYIPEKDLPWWNAVDDYATGDSRWGSMAAFVRHAVHDLAARLGVKLPQREDD